MLQMETLGEHFKSLVGLKTKQNQSAFKRLSVSNIKVNGSKGDGRISDSSKTEGNLPEIASQKPTRKRFSSTSTDTINDDYEIDGGKEASLCAIKPCHKAQRSLFSSASGFDHYRGFLNLCIVLLVISKARVFLENVLKYGILVDPFEWVKAVLHRPYEWPNLLLILGCNLFISIALHIEKLLAKKYASEQTGVYLHSLNLFVLIALPPLRIFQMPPTPSGSAIACLVYAIVFLKLWSYAQANKWYREEFNQILNKQTYSSSKKTSSSTCKAICDQSESTKMEYPNNLSYINIYYFMVAPTLCYETSYPRNPTIDEVYLGKRFVEMLFLLQLELALIQQWIKPTISTAIMPFYHGNASQVYKDDAIVERYLGMMSDIQFPGFFIWLIFFYLFFHSKLNVLAELLRFADREFYKDWWNAESIASFWRKWNMPVYKWCKRHVYYPLVTSGYSKDTALVAVFLLSSILHEYLASTPLQVFKLWGFLAMMVQIPLMLVARTHPKLFSGNFGNMTVWTMLIFLPSSALIPYAHRYYVLCRSVTQ